MLHDKRHWHGVIFLVTIVCIDSMQAFIAASNCSLNNIMKDIYFISKGRLKLIPNKSIFLYSHRWKVISVFFLTVEKQHTFYGLWLNIPSVILVLGNLRSCTMALTYNVSQIFLIDLLALFEYPAVDGCIYLTYFLLKLRVKKNLWQYCATTYSF